MKRNTVEYDDNGTAKACAVCERAAILESDGEHVLCRKKGIVAKDFVCSRFSFDPLKFDPGERVRMRMPFDGEAEMDEKDISADDFAKNETDERELDLTADSPTENEEKVEAKV